MAKLNYAAVSSRIIVGAYLFCIYRTYFRFCQEPRLRLDEHRALIGQLEHLLLSLEKRNGYLANTLRQYCHVASLWKGHDITEFSLEVQLAWDLFHHFQPALEEKAQRARQYDSFIGC